MSRFRIEGSGAVRFVTIMIGILFLFLNILALSLLAFMIVNPERRQTLPSLYKIDSSFDYLMVYLTFICIIVISLWWIAMTLGMIYGAVKGKPSHLLQFFCIQLIDYAITALAAALTAYFCYLESDRLPYRVKFLRFSADWPAELFMVVLVAFILIFIVKKYAIEIVCGCKKSLGKRQHIIRSKVPHKSSANGIKGQQDKNGNGPDYDEAIGQGMKQQPPPLYQAVISNIQIE